MVAREDRAFLARVARVNRELAATALPLADESLDPGRARLLGTQLAEISREYLRRGYPAVADDPVADVVDGAVAVDRTVGW